MDVSANLKETDNNLIAMSAGNQLAPKREIFAWAMFDFANSGYTTVVLTAVFSAYFVGVIAGGPESYSQATATLLWTITLAIANLLVLISVPLVGAIADYRADKKRFLLFTTVVCALFTAMLSLAGPGSIALAMGLIIVSNFMFATGESLIAGFLPEIAPKKDMGRISGYGWTVGYLGGLLVLGLCLAYVTWAKGQGHDSTQYVPITMLITAACFVLAATPTFIFLKERAKENRLPAGESYFQVGVKRLRRTFSHARHFQDLFRFLIALTIFYAGIHTVITLAAVYAQQVMGFTTTDTLMLILVVNVTAAAGAMVFGHVQDHIGSVKTLMITLTIWIAALVVAYFSDQRWQFWVVANMIGVALGASQSAGRALVGQFSPTERSGEFFGLWGLAIRLAAIIGPLSYGLVTYLTQGNHRLALLLTAIYFIVGLIMLRYIDEDRGRKASKGL